MFTVNHKTGKRIYLSKLAAIQYWMYCLSEDMATASRIVEHDGPEYYDQRYLIQNALAHYTEVLETKED